MLKSGQEKYIHKPKNENASTNGNACTNLRSNRSLSYERGHRSFGTNKFFKKLLKAKPQLEYAQRTSHKYAEK